MEFAAREIAAFTAYVERSESDQAAVRIAVDPDIAMTELHALGNVFLQQSPNEGVRERPTGDRLKLITVESDQNRGQRDRRALCHLPLAGKRNRAENRSGQGWR